MPDDPAPPPISERSTLDQAAPSSAGSFGRYKLLQRIGEGGMGEVWLAEQTEPVRRQVALKVIKAGMDSAQVIARFEVERQALALMDHPVIATVFDGGTTPQGRPYFAMEYVKGEPITVYCDRHRLSTKERLGLFIQVCEGVQHAHQKGIIHRDLKPSNVLVTIQDDHPAPKIIDFGVAKATSHHLTERSLFTELGVLIGTPEYMSPEQAEMGGLDIDTRTDIYALGVLLYELLTGSLPFESKELRQAGFSGIQRIIREKEPPRPSTRITQLGPASTEAAANRHTEPRRLASELRGDLDWIAMRALEKDRIQRYQTANALAMDVRRHLNNEPVSAGPPSNAYRAGKFVRRHRFGVAAAAVLVALLGAFAVAMTVQAQRIARERDIAQKERAKSEKLATFMVDLFKVSDPSEARGSTVTAREVLDKGAERVSSELKEQPEIRAALLASMGNVYLNLGLLSKARPLQERALEIRRGALPADHPDLVSSLIDLGSTNRELGDLTRAETLCREAIEIERRKAGGETALMGRALNLLGGVEISRGNYAAARKYYGDALQVRQRVLGNDHPDVDTSYGNLGAILFVAGEYSAAEPVLREVLARRERRYGRDHPQVLSSLNNLASTLVNLGKLDEAESLYRRALEVGLRLYERQSPKVALLLKNTGIVLQRRKQYAAAEPYHREALAIDTKVLGPDHSETAASLEALGTDLLNSGRAVEAEAFLRRAVAVFKKTQVTGSKDTAIAETSLGNCLVALRRFSEAEPLLLESYAVLSTNHGRTQYARDSLDALVSLYEAWGKPEKAKEWRAKLEAQASPAPTPAATPALGHSPN